MTKLDENFKYEKLLEQTGMTNVWSCYRDHGNLVQCKRGLTLAVSAVQLKEPTP